ncbi:hypothetical protein [Streptomyces goshikiensis]|uniref:hypothetical protein n=1 Tax=Streptomyces goshikiensis TaxID=1942 RepID=UPI00380FB219
MLLSVERIRAALIRTRELSGRVATMGGAAVLVSASVTPVAAVALIPAALGCGCGFLMSVAPHQSPAWLKGMYLSPFLTLTAGTLAFQVVPGMQMWELAAVAAWFGITWWVRPSQWARQTAPALAKVSGDTVAGEVLTPTPEVLTSGPLEARLASWWAAAAAVPGGIAPGTWLEQLRVAGPHDWSAQIVAPAGHPVPSVSTERLSALIDAPAELIHVNAVAGSGAGRKQITVGRTAAATDFPSVWAHQVAPTAMPGAQVIRIRRGSTTTGQWEEVAQP